jgi:PAT family beta-lactamase induction signal transducer AmpG
MADAQGPRRPSTWQSLARSFTSWRTACVTLQSFPSGLPLGLVLMAVPAWLAFEGIDIKTIGFVTLVQAPWTFKFLWSPLMDRYAPPFLGRKRGWAVIAQAGLFVSTLALAWAAFHPERIWIVAGAALMVAFASATQDIAIDAYAVEVLKPEEQGVASGRRPPAALLLGRPGHGGGDLLAASLRSGSPSSRPVLWWHFPRAPRGPRRP